MPPYLLLPPSAVPPYPYTPPPPMSMPYPAPAAAAPARAPLSSRLRRWPVISAVLAIALIVVSGFSFIAISSANNDLGNTRNNLANEQTAHKAADAKVAALSACVTALQSDQTALKALQAQFGAVSDRLGTGGDWDRARQAYESALSKAMADFNQAFKDLIAQNETAFFSDYADATTQMGSVESLKSTLDDLSTEVANDQDEANTSLASLTKEMDQTAATCTAAMSSGFPMPSPVTSPAASASTH